MVSFSGLVAVGGLYWSLFVDTNRAQLAECRATNDQQDLALGKLRDRIAEVEYAQRDANKERAAIFRELENVWKAWERERERERRTR